MGETVEYRKFDDVINAYDMYRSDNYAVWHESRLKFQFKGDGAKELLQTNLRALEASGSEAIFTIRFYDESEKAINNKTPYIGSFNFKLTGDQSYQNRMPVASQFDNRYIQRLEEEIKDLIERNHDLEEIQRERDIEDAKKSSETPDESLGKFGAIMSTIGDVGTQYPWLQQIVGNLVSAVTSVVKVPANNFSQPKMNGVGQQNNNETLDYTNVRLTEDEALTINKALAVLKAHDPNIAEHLSKLAVLAQQNPQMYKAAIGFLK